MLLDDVKAYLNYTWEDEPRDQKLTGYINSSKANLEEIAGHTIDFENDQLAWELLLNRVLYMNSQALDDFQKNYNGMLLDLKIKYAEDDSEE